MLGLLERRSCRKGGGGGEVSSSAGQQQRPRSWQQQPFRASSARLGSKLKAQSGCESVDLARIASDQLRLRRVANTAGSVLELPAPLLAC